MHHLPLPHPGASDFTVPEHVETLIIGGGITGTSLANLLHRTGRSALLVEKEDFGSGTSQASGMMIWGGLLYLKNLEFLQVRKFCRARDQLISTLTDEVSPRSFTYVSSKKSGRSSLLMRAALGTYRTLALWKRAASQQVPLHHLPKNFDPLHFSHGWKFEEGFLKESDAHFTLQRLPYRSPHVAALNYCEIIALSLNNDQKWQAHLRDRKTGKEWRITADKIVNCGGIWADEINSRFSIKTHHTHHLSKGVYLLLNADDQPQAHVMDMGINGDTLCWVPWEKVVMWGPTETSIGNLHEAKAKPEDVDFLLEKLNGYSRRTWSKKDIVNVRVGVRPLAVKRDSPIPKSIGISRKAIIEKSPDAAWWTIFGGKLSGAKDFAESIYQNIFAEKPCPIHKDTFPPANLTWITKFGELRLPDPAYCREHLHCRTLEDYLRRRTNVAQWIPNAGWGREFEHAESIHHIASSIYQDPEITSQEVENYKEKILAETKLWNE